MLMIFRLKSKIVIMNLIEDNGIDEDYIMNYVMNWKTYKYSLKL